MDYNIKALHRSCEGRKKEKGTEGDKKRETGLRGKVSTKEKQGYVLTALAPHAFKRKKTTR